MAKLTRISGVAILLLTATIAVHAENLKIGMNFLQARKLLIRNGWHPEKSHPPYGERLGVENLLIKEGVTEVENCAMDSALCIFHYKKKNRCLEIITKGEIVKSMEISSFSHSCQP
ncbi:hypothetical protein [Paraburkholderia adhaesiva]|uniref:hypothetical protein n=1 Tax=Paraburkholderia adhaesiva TaxID=2883244 RepID=UPI001F31250D|nr:hypothetical protein [Paraburkholderia adhaesiva]